MTTTLTRVPEPREISEKNADRIRRALAGVDQAQDELEKAVARALLDGASIRAVRAASGLSENTIQKYGARHGWPTKENRANFNASKYPRSTR